MVQSIINCSCNAAHLLDSLSLTVRPKKSPEKIAQNTTQNDERAADEVMSAMTALSAEQDSTSLPAVMMSAVTEVVGEGAMVSCALDPLATPAQQTTNPIIETTEPSDTICNDEIQFVFDDASPSTQLFHDANGPLENASSIFGSNSPVPSFFDTQRLHPQHHQSATFMEVVIPRRTSSSLSPASSRRQQQFIDDLFVGLRNFGCGDRFKKLHQLGSGASGNVIKVKDRLEKNPLTGKSMYYARKMITLDPQNQIKAKVIKAELESLHHCDCPNVIKLHGAYYDNSCVYLLLDYMDCGSLRDLLELYGPLEEPILAKLVVQLLNGLIYLHEEREIIHRDIKPENILLNREGYVRISDFGMAGLKTSPKGPNGTIYCKSFVGSITYMSPERIQDQKHSCHSDIWSLGLTLAECALGRFPLIGSTGNMYDMWALLSKKSFQIQFPEHASEEFRDFISICMTFDPRTRPSARELLSHPFIIRNTVHLSNGKMRIKGRKFKSWLRDIVKEGYLERLREGQQRNTAHR